VGNCFVPVLKREASDSKPAAGSNTCSESLQNSLGREDSSPGTTLICFVLAMLCAFEALDLTVEALQTWLPPFKDASHAAVNALLSRLEA